MSNQVVKQLARLRGTPAVSILCSFDTRRPGNPHDPAVLKELRDRAADRVCRTVSGHAASSLMARVDDMLAAIDRAHPTPGVAVFVSPEMSRIIPLDSPVDPEVVVGERFAIRGLLTALSRSPRARVVVLSQAKTRCIDVTGDKAFERFDFGFPVTVQPAVEADTPHRDFPLAEHEHAEAAKFVFRAVDHALDALQQHDERSLVLLGAERDLAYFDETSTRRADIVGRLHGDFERETPDAIADLVRPALDTHRLELEQQACAEAREAIKTGAVGGIADAWTAARAGRGHRLVVEDAYTYPARVVGDTLAPARADDPDTLDAVEDTVEEVVRHGGDVMVVRGDSLADLGRIALITRY